MNRPSATAAAAKIRNSRGHWDNSAEPGAVKALQGWSSRTALDAGHALAMSREHPGDLRPEILGWYFSQSDTRIDDIAHYLALRCLIVGARAGITMDAHRIGLAVADALHRVRHRKCEAATSRAKTLKMKKADFLSLRNAAESSLLYAIRSGLRRYLSACGYSDALGTTCTQECVSWNYEERKVA
jgi:hypothetical protein